MKKIITIIGPTAIGKTNLSIELAKLINGQIVGLDSRQIYKGMSIGTAQPTELEMGLVKYHLIGFREPWESISAGEYSDMVIEITKNITKSGFSPIISGGAGLYYRALTSGIFDESTSNMLPVKVPGMFKDVKAIGWYVSEYSRAQISINFTN